MRILIAEYLRVITGYSMVKSVEERFRGYFRLGFQRHVMAKLDLGKAIGSELSGYTELMRLKILDEFAEKFVTGRYMEDLPYYEKSEDTLEKERRELEKFEGMEITERMWKEGEGQNVEDRVRALVYGKLGKYRIAVEDRNDVTLNILMKTRMREYRENLNDEQGIWGDLELQVLGVVGVYLRNFISNVKKHVASRVKYESPVEVLEPGVRGEEGEVRPPVERIDPVLVRSDWFDYDEVMGWVEKYFTEAERLVFFNSLLKMGDRDKIGNKELSRILEEKFKKRVEYSRGVPLMQKGLLDRVHDKFFEGSGIKRKEEGVSREIHELSEVELREFLEYLEEEMMHPSGKGRPRSEEIVERAKGIVGEMANKDREKRKYMVIDEKLGLAKDSTLNLMTKEIRPIFSRWLMKLKKAYQIIGGGGEEELFDEAVVLEGEGDFGKLDVRDQEKVDAVKEFHEKSKEKRDKQVESFNNMIQRRVLKSPEMLKVFKVGVDFKSRYDWDDVGGKEVEREWEKGIGEERGKWEKRVPLGPGGGLHPEYDKKKGEWVRDDPGFSWESFGATMKIEGKNTEIDYVIKFKLTGDGEFPKSIGVGDSKLRVEVDRKGKTHVIDESAGSPVVFRKVLDDYFLGMGRTLGLPIEGEIGIGVGDHPISVNYRNVELDRLYKGTARFKDKMGGLARSNSVHRQKADDYQLFMKKLEEHLSGRGMETREMPLNSMKVFLKNIMKEDHLTKEMKEKAGKWLEGIRDMSEEDLKERGNLEVLSGVRGFMREFEKWEHDYYLNQEKLRLEEKK